MALPTYVTVWLVVVYAWIANYLIRMALGALLPPIMEELRLSYAMAGFLSTALFYAYILMQVPAGFLGDRLGRRRMLVTGVLLAAVASALTGLAGSIVALLAARLLTGLAQGFLFSNDRVLIASTTPRERMALGQGVSFSGAGLGTTLGLLLAGLLGELVAWRTVFFLFALPPLVAAVLLARLPEPAHAIAPADPAWPFRRVLRTADFWLLGAAGAAPVYVQFLLATWGPLLYSEVGVRDLARSAGLASLQGLVAPLGLLASGWVADRLHRRGIHRKAVIAAAILGTSVSMALMTLTVRQGGPAWLLTVLVMAASFCLWCVWGPAYAILGGLFPASVLGRAFGLFNAVCFTGAITGPFVTGWIKDLTGSFGAGLALAAALPLVSIVPVLALGPAFRLRAAPAVAAPERA